MYILFHCVKQRSEAFDHRSILAEAVLEACTTLAQDDSPRDDQSMITAQATMQGFEPYVLVSKKLVPWYDERFTGYLEDKVVHIQTMVHMGFSFAVHPKAFVVHYPHPDSSDQALVKSTGLMQEVTIAFISGLQRSPLPFNAFTSGFWTVTAAFHRSLLPFINHCCPLR